MRAATLDDSSAVVWNGVRLPARIGSSRLYLLLLQYEPVATPHAFIFDAARKLRYAGAIDASERVQQVQRHHVREALDALLAGKEPPVTKTKVVGCSVKWAGKAELVKAYLEKLVAEPVAVSRVDAAALKVIYRESGSIGPLEIKRALVKAMNERKPW
jgi:hypothetical protein